MNNCASVARESGWIEECGGTWKRLSPRASWPEKSLLDRVANAEEALRMDGASAERRGVKWWNNPHPAGSVAAYEWDKGHTAGRRIRDAQK